MSDQIFEFRTGFDIVDRYYRNEESDRRFDEQMGLQRQRMGMDQEQHQASMQQQGLQTQILQNQVNDIPDANQYRDKTRSLNISTAERQNQAAGLELDITKSKKTWAEEDRKTEKANERLAMYRATGNWDGFDQDETFKGTNLELMQNEIGRQHAIALGDSLNNNDIKAAIASANGLFKSQLNRNVGKMKGRDGGVIRDISIVGIEQMEDGKSKVPVQVTTDKGVYTSYISEMRGIDPNDPERVFTGDELLGTAAAMANMARILKGSDAYKNMNEAADRALGVTKSTTSQVPAEVQRMAYTRQILGDEKFEQWLMYGRGKSPDEMKMEAYKVAADSLGEEIFDTPEEKRAAINEFANSLLLSLNQRGANAPRDLGDDPLGIR